MPRETIVVCAKCNSPNAVPWTLACTRLGRRRVDLCPRCSRPLVGLMGLAERIGSTRDGRASLASRFVDLDGESE